MDEKELKKACLKLMETEDAVYLSTISEDGFPHTRMMGNLRNEQQCKVAKELFAGHDEVVNEGVLPFLALIPPAFVPLGHCRI